MLWEQMSSKSQSTFLNNDNTYVDNDNTYDNDKTYITHTITHMIQNIRFKTKKTQKAKKRSFSTYSFWKTSFPKRIGRK